ncbi:SDR family NAD(P)-dependent oxidoreductase [Croceicoccus ponticola]|uniref:SDR family NAD(P)-dependent oxidoreductase n=1 Tax=Croceicoccus ponticola TaxID=2217664 RepID=UPI0023EA6C2C|nr:SDR family oxidoreductase [Croceicoccus ponticola]
MLARCLRRLLLSFQKTRIVEGRRIGTSSRQGHHCDRRRYWHRTGNRFDARGKGARLIVNDSARDAADNVVDEIHSNGGAAFAEYSAVGTPASASAITDAVASRFGRIDILVNNAGISRPAPFGQDSDADIELVFAVNLLGPYSLMRRVWPMMIAQGGGTIVNTASSAALGSGASGAYAPSKAGIIGLTKEAAIAGEEYVIRVNAIMPSAWTTLLDKHPDESFRNWMQQHFPPRMVAAATTFLASPQCDLNGQILIVGGGYVSRLCFSIDAGITDKDLTPEALESNIDAIALGSPIRELMFQRDLQDVYFGLFPR